MTRQDDLPADLVAAATRRRNGITVFNAINPARTALLALNMQNAWLADDAAFDKAGRARAILPQVNRLANALRQRGGSVIWLQHTTNPPGHSGYWSGYFDHFVRAELRGAAAAALAPGQTLHALHPDTARDPADLVLPKHRFSAFLRNPHDLEALLRQRGVDTVIVAGTATNVCCESTAREAMMRDFRTFMPHDAVAAPDREAHLGALRSLMQVFADVRATADLLALLSAETAVTA